LFSFFLFSFLQSYFPVFIHPPSSLPAAFFFFSPQPKVKFHSGAKATGGLVKRQVTQFQSDKSDDGDQARASCENGGGKQMSCGCGPTQGLIF